MWGKSQTPFERFIDPFYEDGMLKVSDFTKLRNVLKRTIEDHHNNISGNKRGPELSQLSNPGCLAFERLITKVFEKKNPKLLKYI